MEKRKKKKRGDDKPIHFFIFLFFVVFFYTVKIVPSVLYPFLSGLGGLIAFYTMGENRKLILKNMDIVYGNTISKRKKQEMCRQIFTGIIMSLCECIQMSKITDEQFINMAVIEGEEVLQKALGEGKGVVGISAHLGNFPRLQAVLAKKGYPITCFAKTPSGRHLTKFFKKFIVPEDVPLLYISNRRQAIIDAHRWIKNKGILCFHIDQHDSKGVEVEFFGKNVLAPTGAATFARRYNCPVLGLFTYRMADGRQKIIIEGPYKLQKTDNATEDIRINTGFFLKRIEHYIRLYPEHWYSWLYKRFPDLY